MISSGRKWAGVLFAATALAVLGSSGVAAAMPTFPSVVDQFVDQPGLVEGLFPNTSPPGCDLCHVNGSMGGTPLTVFGSALQIQSVPPTNGELTSALTALQQSHPSALNDLEMGMDPNKDPALTSGLEPPEYGCTFTRRPASGYAGALSVLFSFMGLGAMRIRRRRVSKVRAG